MVFKEEIGANCGGNGRDINTVCDKKEDSFFKHMTVLGIRRWQSFMILCRSVRGSH